MIMKINIKTVVFITLMGWLFYSCAEPTETTQTVSDSPSAPEWVQNATIYEVNVRQFSEEGSFEQVQEALPRLRDLGVDILWLMPIHPIGEVERKGTMGSYYSIKDYFDVNPEFGTKDDFRSLVEATHEHGMKIILDWVANHTAWDNPLTETNPEFYELDESGNFMPPRGTDWSDVIQLDYENMEVWDYMVSALRYWVEEFNIDGYRADVAYMVPTEFWNRARAELDQIKPVFMVAEAETPELHPAFDMSYAWTVHHMLNSVAAGEEPITRIDEVLADNRERFPDDAIMMNFTSNHDENSWNGTVFERLGDGAKVFAALTIVMEGMPLVYNGQEVGLNKRLEFFEKDPIEWDLESPFLPFYMDLLNLKRTNSALGNGKWGAPMVRFLTTAPESVYSFYRSNDDNTVIALLNLTDEPVSFQINDRIPLGEFRRLFSGETVFISATDTFELDAWGYTILHR